MNVSRIAAIFLRQFYLFRDNRTRLFSIVIWITLDVVLWGFITKYLNVATGGGGFKFVPAFLGAVILWDFLIRVQQGIMMAFFEDVWSRNFLNIFSSPIRISEYLTGIILTSIVTSSIGLIVMFILSSTVFGFSLFSLGLFAIPFFLILFAFGMILGILTIAIILRYGPAAEWFAWPIPFMLSPFVGVFYPISVLPEWMQYVSSLLPPSYVFEGMRALIFQGQFETATLGLGGGLAIIYIFLAYAIFVRVYRRAVKSGLLARYSAESIT